MTAFSAEKPGLCVSVEEKLTVRVSSSGYFTLG